MVVMLDMVTRVGPGESRPRGRLRFNQPRFLLLLLASVINDEATVADLFDVESKQSLSSMTDRRPAGEQFYKQPQKDQD